ncbi:uncharacterized protein LOC106665339 isoform X2 [Cimex lectularius]|uniref:Uncharacterized protein n=1 Tax=Cimex lectularius TaxID=79782 RepID=A0A8I6RKR1_CIMLE|nr:uncharacterized protein LOC106665339 isoform X2 [Cimex lectularius]
MASVATNKPLKPAKKAKEFEICEKMNLIDAELVSFYEFCEQMGFTSKEMEVICSPLNDIMCKNNFKKLIKLIVILSVLFGFAYGSSQMTSITVHATALGRIALIKVLSLWDWRYLFYESCLLENPLYGEYTLTKDDCITCEALDSITVINRINYELLLDNYFNRDIPVIITDAMDKWPVMITDEFYFDNITQDEKLIDTVPCVLTTNLRMGSSDLVAFLKIISNPSVTKWFVHWQNCDIHAVKALRKFYQRPYFLSNTISPAHFNWVLMSSDYRSSNYKKVELDFGLIMLLQLRGLTSFRLTPHKPCNESCATLTGDLHQGEILVFKNYMWTFEYYPGIGLDNIAILSETVWDQNSVTK